MSNARKQFFGVLKLLVYAGLSFGVTYCILSFSHKEMPKIFNYQNTIISTIITMLIVLGLTLLMKKYLKHAKSFKEKADLADKYADEYDNNYHSHFFIGSWMMHLIWITAILNIILVTIFIGDDYAVWSITFIPFTACAFINGLYVKYLSKIDSKMPKYSNSDYNNQLIAAMDEGEKHISYSVLFKLYQYNLSLLMIIVITLAVYSAVTGTDFAIALVLVFALYIFNLVFYYSQITKYYKQ